MQTDFAPKSRRKIPPSLKKNRDFHGDGGLSSQNRNATRYLDPKHSRWMNADPAVSDYMAGSDAGGGIYNLANFNIYHYGGNNPLRYTDPTGAFDFDEGAAPYEIPINVSNEGRAATMPFNMGIDGASHSILANGWHDTVRRQKNIDASKDKGIDLNHDPNDIKYWNEIMQRLASGADDWYEENRKSCHVPLGTDPDKIRKFCNANGAEVVLYVDENGDYHLMTDPRYEGTYNYSPPVDAGGTLGHATDDLIPWIRWGNGNGDTTTLGERWAMMLYTYPTNGTWRRPY